MKRIPMICLSLFSLARSYAHDFYVLPDSFRIHNGSRIRVFFHNGDSFPASEVAPVLARLKDAQLLGNAGVSRVQALHVSDKEVVGTVEALGNGSLWLSAHTIPHLIELPPYKFLAYLKEEGLEEVVAWRSKHNESNKPGRERYSKFAKALLQSGKSDEFYRHPLGYAIEIIPLADPYAVHVGGTLPVRVLFDAEPAAGIQLEAAWSSGSESKTLIVGRTDLKGNIDIPIAKAGKWRLHALKMQRCSEPPVADWESFWASLTFETS